MIKIFLVLIVTAIIALNLPPQWSLLIGLAMALGLPLPKDFLKFAKTATTYTLQFSIVLLGASLNFQHLLQKGSQGLLITGLSILLVLGVGEILARIFKVSSPLSSLISVGTAICGGSAIGAISPILRADSLTLSISLGIIFLLNALSVMSLAPIGHLLGLDQVQFGTWAALAIHDTSSVVAACQMYGEEALKVGTTLKLTRALWIIPVSLAFTLFKRSTGQIKFPWFILLFMLHSLLFSLLPSLHSLVPAMKVVSKVGFSLTLFFVGVSLNREELKKLQFRPLVFALTLWFLTLLSSLYYVKNMGRF